MITIYKYEVPLCDEVTFRLPEGFKVLHLDIDPNNKICFWALVDTSKPLVLMNVLVFGTGHSLPDEPGQHLGTVIQGAFVWHVFQHN